MKKKILKILMMLCMFSLSAPVFANSAEAKAENNVKETFKTKNIFEWLTNIYNFEKMDDTTKCVICDFLAREIRRSDKYSENLKKFVKNNKIFSDKKIIENFEKILREIKKAKEGRIKDSKGELSKFGSYVETDKFKKEYTEYKLAQADSWEMVGESSKAIKYVEKDLIKKYGKKVENMTEKEKIKYNEELNEKAKNIDEKLKDKFNKEVENEVKDMRTNAKKFSGKHFEEYVKLRKEELEREIKVNEGDLKYLEKILKNKDILKTAKEIFIKVNKTLPDDQKENFDYKKMVDLPKAKEVKKLKNKKNKLR